MSDINFQCPKCAQKLAVDASAAGIAIDCPSCGSALVIPGNTQAPGENLKASVQETPVGPGANDTPPPSPRTNPNLSATLRADYEALKNDMDQANELAANYQRQLAGKSNEFAELKKIFEKTQDDLRRLQAGIAELRIERHDLANQAMRAIALERKLTEMTTRYNSQRVELETLRRTAAAAGSETEEIARRDAQIARLTMQLERIKDQTAGAGRSRRSIKGAAEP